MNTRFGPGPGPPGPFGARVVVPWTEGAFFGPPYAWWHQHFNVGPTPARYLTLHPARPAQFAAEQHPNIEYPDEDPWMRQNFEQELARRGLKSEMPAECYTDYDYKWDYSEDD